MSQTAQPLVLPRASPLAGIAYSDHGGGDGKALTWLCRYGLEGGVSKRLDRADLPGDRVVCVKTKCFRRSETTPAASNVSGGGVIENGPKGGVAPRSPVCSVP